MFIMPANSINYAGTLTNNECKACKSAKLFPMYTYTHWIFLDFASDDINKNLQAYFSCPKKLRLTSKKRITRIEKHSSED
jgi:hypothetical protein